MPTLCDGYYMGGEGLDGFGKVKVKGGVKGEV